jgi:hypothetical protein
MRRAAQPYAAYQARQAKRNRQSLAQLLQERTAAALRRAGSKVRGRVLTAEQEQVVGHRVAATFEGAQDAAEAAKNDILPRLQYVIDALRASASKLHKMSGRKAQLLLNLCLASHIMQVCTAFGDAGWLRASKIHHSAGVFGTNPDTRIKGFVRNYEFNQGDHRLISKQLRLLGVPEAQQQAVLQCCSGAARFHWPESLADYCDPTIPDM